MSGGKQWGGAQLFYLATTTTDGSGGSAGGEDVGDLRDLLHCKMGCWFLPSLCFASSRPRPQ